MPNLPVSLALGLALFAGACAREAPPPLPARVDYLGQPPPGDTARVFAPGTISLPVRREGSAVFAPDGRTFYFGVSDDSATTILAMRLEDGSWTSPEPVAALHEPGFGSWEPFVTPDGGELYFVSNRPPGAPPMNGRIWVARRGASGWTAPRLVDLPVETERGLWFPTVAADGTLYFGADLAGGLGRSDLYSARRQGGTYVVTPLGEGVNTPHEEWDPFIAPDGSFLLFTSDRPGGFGRTDHYVSFRRADGTWAPPVNLGAAINSEGYDVAARLSPDGAYLFFDRPRPAEQDIYWIDAGVIEAARSATP